MIKTFDKMGIEGTYLSLIKSIYEKPIVNVVFNEKLNVFLLKSGTWSGCPLSALLFNIVLEVLDTAIREDKEIKGIWVKRETVELSLYADDKLPYRENCKDSTQKLLELIKKFDKGLAETNTIL